MKKIIKINKYRIYLLILTVFLSLFSMNTIVFADCKPGDKSNCAAAEQCKPAKDGKKLSSASASINGKCVKEKTANGCYNSNPTSCSGPYGGLRYRPKGAGPNDKPRNHLGSDIGSKGCPDISSINVYAPADGTIVYTGVGTCSGRSMVIEHENKCSGGKFRTILRHLIAFKKTSGAVKKGEVVGIEGGSNAVGHGLGDICDNPSQTKYSTYTRSGCGRSNPSCGSKGISNYAIHLHMETVDGKMVGSSSAAGSVQNVMQSYCGGVQALCGGCPVDLSSCGGNTAISSDGTSASTDGLSGGSDGGDFSGGGSNYRSDTCDFKSYLDSQNCTFCELFKKLWNAASIMAKTSNDALATPTKALVSLGFLIWICVYLLKQVASFSKIGTGEMLKGILFQGFRVAVVIIALSGAIYELMDLTINPVMQTGLNFSRTLNKEAGCDVSASYMQNIVGYDETTGFPKPQAESSAEIGGLSKHLGESIICNLKTLEDKTGFLMSLGKYSMCIGIERHPMFGVKGFLPGLGYFSTGIFLWITGLLLLLSFPWCLVDCILQLCIAVALLPCAVGAYAFKITAQYLKMIWNMFMNAMFNFVFMAIIIYIINANLGAWIGYTPGSYPQEEVFITALQSYGLAWWGIGFFKIVVVCLFCWSFFDEASSMANEFCKGMGMHNIGRKVGGTVSSAALNKVIQPGAAIAGNVALGGARHIGEAINSQYGNSFRSGSNRLKGEIIKRLPPRFRHETVNADGTTSVTATYSFMGFEHTRTITKDADGIYTQTKEMRKKSDKFGTRSTNDAFMRTKEMIDENGNVVGRSIKFNNTTAKYLVKEDGTINEHAMRQMINGAQDKERAYEGIMLIVAEKRGMGLNDRFQNRDVKVNNDKSVTITQTNLDGTKQILTAKMVGDQMVLSKQSFDRRGNPIKFQKTNGMRTRTEIYEQQSDGSFAATVRHGFTEQYNDALNEDEEWKLSGKIDARKIMAGFDKNDFDEHITQMKRARTTKNDRMPKNFISLNNISKDEVAARMQWKSANPASQTNPQPTPVAPTPETPVTPQPTPVTPTPELHNEKPNPQHEPQPVTPEEDFIIDKNDKGEIVTYSLEEMQKRQEAERKAQEERQTAQKAEELHQQQRQEAERKAQEERQAAQKAEELRQQQRQEAERKAQEERQAAQKAEELRQQQRQEAERKAQEERQAAQKAEELRQQQQQRQENERKTQEERLAAQKAEELRQLEQKALQEKEELKRLRETMELYKEEDRKYIKALQEQNQREKQQGKMGITETDRKITTAVQNAIDEQRMRIQNILIKLDEAEYRQKLVREARGISYWKEDPASVELQKNREELQNLLDDLKKQEDENSRRIAIEKQYDEIK